MTAYNAEANDFLFENFNKESPKFKDKLVQRKRFFWKIQEISHDFNLIVEGLFFHIKSALEHSHIRGDRGLLNSESPFYVPNYSKIQKSLKPEIDYEHLKDYACFLSNPDAYFYPKKVISSDFINDSLKKYLSSLSDYKVVPESHVITNKDSIIGSASHTEIIYLNIKNKNSQILGFQDVGSGLSYVMPILTSLWASNFSLVEQPELHLHPKAQCELGDVFISAYNQGSISVIESHSEHLLLRVLRRIRETTNKYLLAKELKITADDVSIYYFEPVPEGHTIVKKIRVDRYGELLDYWPGGFFSERDSELF